MKRILKWARNIALLIILFLIFGFLWLRSSLPQTTGAIDVDGITADVTIARDKHGIPHISGDNWTDVYYGVGFAHAQDRLWQLEMNRRIGSGRLSEVVGKDGLATDRFFRTLGFRDRAEKALKNLLPEEREILDAYARGINAFLKSHSGALPPEFVMTGIEPEPWTPTDSLVWGKMMWLSLSGNYRRELARAQLLTKLSPEQVAQLYPTYPGEFEHPLPDMAKLLKELPITKLAEFVGDEKPNGYGSNNWVISGERTKSGKPILANDPHLGLTTPSIWYLVRLHNRSENKNVVGVGFPGSPTVVLGRNDNIAWGFTNTATDVQDLFIEKLMNDPAYYQTPTGPAKFINRQEVIKVKDSDNVTLNVRETRHGPVMTDILDKDRSITPEKHVLALQWTALGEKDTMIKASAGLMYASNFKEMNEAAAYYMGPQQNMIYADTKGNIGYFSPSIVPLRHGDNEINGRLPSPGWIAKYDWQGFLPIDQMPRRYNVENGIIATANEKIVPHSYPHFLTRDWSLPYRGNRIRNRLGASTAHTMGTMKDLQYDIVSDMARDMKSLLPDAVKEKMLPHLKALKAWDGTMSTDRFEPLLFDLWFQNYSRSVMADELGNLYNKTLRKRPYFLKNVWAAETKNQGSKQYYSLPPIDDDSYANWCDDISTKDKKESCSDLARQSFENAVTSLENKYGADHTQWRWGTAHNLTQTHRPFGSVKQLADFFQVAGEQSGGTYTINVAGNSWRDLSMNNSSFGPSYRGLFDMSNLDNSMYHLPTGQSGNPLSSHFDDMFPLWQKGDYLKVSTKQIVPDDADVLVLKVMK